MNIPEGVYTDANDFKKPFGIVRIRSNSGHLPTGIGAGVIVCLQINQQDYYVQFHNSIAGLFRRTCSNGTWEEWQAISLT